MNHDQAVVAQLGKPQGGLAAKTGDGSFSLSRAFGRDCVVVFYRTLFINSLSC